MRLLAPQSGDVGKAATLAQPAARRRPVNGYNAAWPCLRTACMSWISVAIAIVCLYLAFKVVGFLLKTLLWLAVAACLFWWLAPMAAQAWPP